jgi:hypothetical protein
VADAARIERRERGGGLGYRRNRAQSSREEETMMSVLVFLTVIVGVGAFIVVGVGVSMIYEGWSRRR